MMLRPSTIVWMVLWVVAAFGLYMVKYKVQAVKVEVATAEKQLREETRNLHVLTAEWTYLNRPDRIRTLAAKYLSEKPVQGKQMAEFSTLPYSLPAALAQSKERPMLPKGVTLASDVAHDE